MEKDRKIKKVILEYDDGSSKYVENEDAKLWDEWIAGVCIFAYVHNCNPDWSQLKWKETSNKINIPY